MHMHVLPIVERDRGGGEREGGRQTERGSCTDQSAGSSFVHVFSRIALFFNLCLSRSPCVFLILIHPPPSSLLLVCVYDI